MRNDFPDHFSGVAAGYASHRPRYPAELFDYLAGLAPRRGLAWDCAAGSGQATLDLASRFARVVATDASTEQIAAAPPHPRVEYRVARAEASGLADSCADLITVAQALHWFDLDRFHAEVRRVLVPRGVLAAWSYGTQRIEDPAIDQALQRFYGEVVGPYWPAERRIVETGYRTLPFPFDELPAPNFDLVASWPLPELLGYVRTWSATSRYRAARGHDPVVLLERELAPLWGSADEARRITWPLALRVGRSA